MEKPTPSITTIPTLQFNEFPLSEELLKSVLEMGFTTPSPIQAQALPMLLGEPTDFIGLAATGTGKTAAFAIPLLEKIDKSIKKVQALIMCPTRELAMQVSGQINSLGKHKGVRSITIYGGSSYADQMHGLKSGAQVVVGTPGRLVDHMKRDTLQLGELKVLVLDEADEMISMGFKDDLETVLKKSPRETSKIWLFSATMSREVRKVADTYLKSPKQVQVNKTEMLSSTVKQIYYVAQESNKPDVLCKVIEEADDLYGIIFCQTKSLVADLTQYLQNRGYKVDCLHGDKDQTSRERTMQAFRSKKVTLLVCTDVASRGLDVKDVTHVINYSIPRELENYVHRIGRTARSGKSGLAISLVTPSQRGLVGRVEALTKTRMVEAKPPTRRDIGQKKVTKVLPKFLTQEFFQRAVDTLDETWKTAIADMSKEEIAGRFLTLLYADIFVDKKDSSESVVLKADVLPEREREKSNQREERDRYRSRPGDRYKTQRDNNPRGAEDGPRRAFSEGGPARRSFQRDEEAPASSSPRRTFSKETTGAPARKSFNSDEPGSRRTFSESSPRKSFGSGVARKGTSSEGEGKSREKHESGSEPRSNFRRRERSTPSDNRRA